MSFTKKIVTTYSKALFQNVKNTKPSPTSANYRISQIFFGDQKAIVPTVSITGDELFVIRNFYISSKKVQEFIGNPTCAEQKKLDFLLESLKGLTGTMQSFLNVLKERSHLSLLPEISEEYNRILLSFKKSSHVKIITAGIFQNSYGFNLLKALRELTGSVDVTLSFSYNPKLLGGLILEYNSSAIDASILKEFSLFFNEI